MRIRNLFIALFFLLQNNFAIAGIDDLEKWLVKYLQANYNYYQTWDGFEVKLENLKDDKIFQHEVDIINAVDINIINDKHLKAKIVFKLDGKLLEHKISGKIIKKTKIAVLNRKLRIGEAISKNDLSYILVGDSLLSSSVILDMNSMLGMVTKNHIQPFKAIKHTQITNKILVKKKDLVKILFAKNRIKIKMNGKALDAGAFGDRIRVQNLDTKKIINAVVKNVSEVEVQ